MTGLQQASNMFELHRILLNAPPAPASINRSEWSRLQKHEQLAHIQDRLEYLASDFVLDTPTLQRGKDVVRMVRRRNDRPNKRIGRQLVVFSGPGGSGKTTAIVTIAMFHAIAVHAEDPTRGVSVLGIEVPPTATPKSLLEAFLDQLCIIPPSRATLGQLMKLVVGQINTLGIELVLVDEFGHLGSRKQSAVEAARTLKALSNQVRATFVCSGVEADIKALMSGPEGQQLARRSMLESFSPMTLATDSGPKEWRGLIRAFEEELRMLDQRIGTLQTHAAALFDRTGGSIGTLRNLLTDSAMDVLQAHEDAIQRGHADRFVEALSWEQIGDGKTDYGADLFQRSSRRRKVVAA